MTKELAASSLLRLALKQGAKLVGEIGFAEVVGAPRSPLSVEPAAFHRRCRQSINDDVSAGEDGMGDRKPDRPCRPRIDAQLKPTGKFNGKRSGLRAAKNLVDLRRPAMRKSRELAFRHAIRNSPPASTYSRSENAVASP